MGNLCYVYVTEQVIKSVSQIKQVNISSEYIFVKSCHLIKTSPEQYKENYDLHL